MSDPIYKSRPSAFALRPASLDRVHRINDFIHVSEGLSNSFLISTPAGRIVVNTGMGFEGPTRRAAYDEVDASPTRYIILTQGHVDHVGGVDCFLEEGTDLIAQQNNQEHQSYDGRIGTFRAMRSYFAFAEAIDTAGHLPDVPQPVRPPKQSVPVPTITFEDHYAFALGGLEIELFWTPGGETRDSLVIWLPQHRICLAGNLFSCLFGHIPNLVTIRGDRYRDALEFVSSIDRVRDLEPDLLLVGHGGPLEGASRIREEIERVRGATLYVHDAVVQGMNANKTVHQLMGEIELPPELEVGQGYGKVAWDVRAIWEYYAGWFHHASTTELYPEPATSMYAELTAMAGGAAAVAAQAATRLAEGQPLRAIHLAEVALASDAEHRMALEVYRDAHRALEEKSVNFWETKWLQNQIAQTEKKLAAH